MCVTAWERRDGESARALSLTHPSRLSRGSVATRKIFLKYFVFTIAESSFLLILLFSIIFNLNYYFLFEVLLCVCERERSRKVQPTTICLFFPLGQMRSNGHSHREREKHKHTRTHIQTDRQTNRKPPSSNKSTQLQNRHRRLRSRWRQQTTQKVNKIYLFFIYLHDNFSSNSTEC